MVSLFVRWTDRGADWDMVLSWLRTEAKENDEMTAASQFSKQYSFSLLSLSSVSILTPPHQIGEMLK